MREDPQGLNGGDLVAEVLCKQGVRFLFTLCGGHISPILVASKARGIRVVDVRHEASAVFAADAVARLTGVPGVAAVTAGPGVTNAVTAVKNAQLAQSPLVLLGGATATALEGRGSLQDIDQRAVLGPHVKRVERARRVRDLAPALQRAFATARSGVPGPVFVECPVDLLYPADVVRKWYGAKSRKAQGESWGEAAVRLYLNHHVNRLFSGVEQQVPDPVAASAPEPPTGAARRAARLLEPAQRPVLLIGSQALLFPDRVGTLVDAVTALGIPTYLSGMARGLLGTASPLQLRHKRKEALRAADLVLLAGAPCDFRLDYGRHINRRAAVVAANLSRTELRKNRRPALGVQAAPDLFLVALAHELGAQPERWSEWWSELRGRDEQREQEIRSRSGEPADGVHPLRLCRELDRVLDDDSVIVADGGDFISTASYVVRPRAPLSWLDPGVFGTLGVGAGFALGASLCRPGAEIWLLYGDGSAGYSLVEADTFVRHGLPVIAVIGNDAGWTQIAREQVEVLRDDVGTVLRSSDYHQAVKGFGATGLLIEKDEDAPAVLADAKAAARAGKPVYVNVRLGRSDFRKGSLSM